MYLIDETPRQVTRANTAYIEADTLDFNNDDIFITMAVHFDPTYKTDNKKRWGILEVNLVNSDPFNHIAEFSIRKDGRAARKALKSHYEGIITFKNSATQPWISLRTPFIQVIPST